MKNFLALLGIGDFLFLAALIGAKRANDLAISLELYPWLLWGGIVLLIVIVLVIIFKKEKKLSIGEE